MRVWRDDLPSREERAKDMGGPKSPRLGRFSPKTVEVPPVDDLLAEMGKAIPPKPMPSSCTADCSCLPCQRGQCGSCYVEALSKQEGADKAAVRAAATKFRGTVYDD